MMKRRCFALFLLIVLLGTAAAEGVHFPLSGIAFAPDPSWVWVAPATVADAAPLLADLGLNAAAVAVDLAATNAVFAVYLPGGVVVTLSVTPHGQARSLVSSAHMLLMDRDAFTVMYQRVGAVYGFEDAGIFAIAYQRMAGTIVVSFLEHLVIENGALYRFVASGVIGMDELTAALGEVERAVSYIGTPLFTPESSTYTLPLPVLDDGVVTAVALLDFVPVSTQDETPLTVKAGLGTELRLKTANDTLRVVVPASGQHTFTLSTRRVGNYPYTLTATLSGRQASEIALTVERRLSGEALLAQYKRDAVALSTIGYVTLTADPFAHLGAVVTVRGRIEEITEVDGFPAAKISTHNVGAGRWDQPIWGIYGIPLTLSVGDIVTVTGDVRGDIRPAGDDWLAVLVLQAVGK